MAHQRPQHLQRNTGIRHVHCVAVAERVWGHRDRERHAAGRRAIHRFFELGTDHAVGDFLDMRLFHPPGAPAALLQRDLQLGYHHLQLADVLRIGERGQPMSLAAGNDAAELC